MRYRPSAPSKLSPRSDLIPTNLRDRVIRLTIIGVLLSGIVVITQTLSVNALRDLTFTRKQYSSPTSSYITESNIINKERMLEMTSNNRHMVYLHQPDILLVTMAKAGSSTLYHWLYRGLTGKPKWDNKQCESHIHDKNSKCWQGYLSTLHTLPENEQWRILTSKNTFRVAIQREPYERLISAYKSKFTCEDKIFGTDIHERTNMVNSLIKYTNLPIESYQHNIITNTTDPNSSKRNSITCMSITDFANALEDVRSNVNAGSPYPNSLSELDDHIRPQNFHFDEIEYKMILDVNHLSNLSVLTPLINRLPFKSLVEQGISRRHASGDNLLSIPEDAAALIHNFALESKPGKVKFYSDLINSTMVR